MQRSGIDTIKYHTNGKVTNSQLDTTNESQEVSPFPYFCRKLGKMWQNLSSAAVVIGALRVKYLVSRYLRVPD